MDIQVIQKSLELQPQESTSPKTGDEVGFLAARNGLPISQVSEALVREALRYCMVKVGLRHTNFPEGAEKVLLLNHVVGFYGNHTADEIRLAFDMALSAKLGLDTQDVKCYENFSCAYFSKIMNAYRKWSSQEYRQISKPEAPPQRFFTDEELEDGAREDANRQYILFLRGVEIKNTSINKPILEKDGLLKEGEEVIDFFERKAKLGILNIYEKK